MERVKRNVLNRTLLIYSLGILSVLWMWVLRTVEEVKWIVLVMFVKADLRKLKYQVYVEIIELVPA